MSHTLNPVFVATICAAAVGKRLTLESLKEFALMEGLESFLQLQEAGRAWFAKQFAHKVIKGHESLAYMQKDKIPGASTFYTYTQTIVKMLKAGDVGALADLTTSQLNGKTAKGAKAKGEDKAPKPEARALTIDDAIAAILTAHSVGALTPAQYAQLASIKAPAQVAEPADVVQALPALRIAA